MTPAEYVERYDAGESILSLANEARVRTSEMRELLVNAGGVIRKRGGARGLHRAFHMTTSAGQTDGATRGRIVRPSVRRMYR